MNIPNMISYQDVLQELRRRHANGEVSALVGAGFSRNAYLKFPLWGDLLYDMILELYENEIKRDFADFNHRSKRSTMGYLEFRTSKIWEIASREGYLEIVSKYIQRKGFREAVECYIEDRIPQIDFNTSMLTTKTPKISVKLDANNLECHKKLIDGRWDNIYTTNYDQLIELAAQNTNLRWSVITKATDLSFSKAQKGIIKLHGALNNEANSDFVFDGNYHHRYIISKEDYENYPTDHEAFTQLMRISLLQGSFCLMGFSGDDPNFISWIKWVRDILVLDREGANKNNPLSSIKIFLVDVSDKLPSPEKQLFYNNHKIFYIPLLRDEVKKILNSPCINGPQDYPKIINAFLDYIYEGIKDPETRYIQLWNKLTMPIKDPKSTVALSIDNGDYNEISNLRKDIKFHRLIEDEKKFLFVALSQNITDSRIVDLILWAMLDLHYLPQDFGDKEYNNFVSLALTNEQESLKKLILDREDTLLNPKRPLTWNCESDSEYYEKLLNLCFSLEFSELKERLNEWEPKGRYLLHKAFFMAMLFDQKEASKLLLQYKSDNDDTEDQYFATQIYNSLICNWFNRLSVKFYTRNNIKGIKQYIDSIWGELKEKKEKTKPFGDHTESYTLDSGPNEYEYAIRAIQFMMEKPIFPATFINNEQWFNVFKQLYERFPNATLFYSLFVDDTKISRRIGQEFAYSDLLFENGKLEEMLISLLNTYVSINMPRIDKNISVLAKELMISVPANKWEYLFEKIWTEKIFPNLDNKIPFGDELQKLIIQGVSNLSDDNIKLHILKDCLDKGKSNINFIISILYHLNTEGLVIGNEINQSIDEFIKSMDNVGDYKVLGNIHTILSDEQINEAVNKASEILQTSNSKNIHFNALAYLTNKVNADQTLLKKTIIDNPNLWANGIIDETTYGMVNFIRLSDFSYFINWTQDEILSIYNKLKSSYEILITSTHFKENKSFLLPDHYEDLLLEMQYFLNNYKYQLSKQIDFADFYRDLVGKVYFKSGFNSIEEAIFCKDRRTFINGLNELQVLIHAHGVNEHIDEIMLILDRILFSQLIGFEYAIQYVDIYLNELLKKDNSLPKKFYPKLRLILDQLSVEKLKDADLDVTLCLKYIIKLAEMMKGRSGFKAVVDKWLSLKDKKRFINI